MAQTFVAYSRVATIWGGAPSVAAELYADLVDRYREPHRHYHTLEHIGEVLEQVDGTEVELAAWYHDVIYDTRRSDNEARSAEHAAAALERLGAPSAVIDEVRRLILLTAGHTAAPGDARGNELIAADLSILTSDRARYQRYARDVRAEYAHLDDETWRTGRTAVLQALRSVVADDSNIAWELRTLSST